MAKIVVYRDRTDVAVATFYASGASGIDENELDEAIHDADDESADDD